MRGVGPIVAALTVASCLVGCGDDGATSDASADAPGPDAGGRADPPAPPASPVLTPCPEGWEEREDEGVTTCAPFPGRDGPERCGRADSAWFPGEPACRVVGTECDPSSDFATDLPTDRAIVYALAGATGGDGSEASPYGTIAEAIRAAPVGAVVAVGKGRYDEAVTVRDNLTLWGACTAETVLTSSVAVSNAGVIAAGAGASEVRNLRVADARRSGIVVTRSDAELTLRSVIIADTEVAGLVVVLGGSLVAEDLVVRDTRELSPDGVFGRGMVVQDGSSVVIRRGEIARNTEIGLFVSDEGTTLRLEDVVVWDNQSLSSGYFGRGLVVQSTAAVEVVRSVFAQNGNTGVLVGDAGASLDLEDVAILTTHEARNGDEGVGLVVQDGVLNARRLLLVENQATALFAAGPTTTARIDDVVILRTGGRDGDALGRGIDLIDGAVVEVFRAHLASNHELGATAHGGSRLHLEDVTIADTEADLETDDFGRGVTAQSGGTLELVRAVLRNNRDVGIYAKDEGTRLVLTDVVVDGVREQLNDGTGGRGLNVQEGASVTWDRGVIRGTKEIGIFVHSAGTSATLTNLVLEGIEARVCAVVGSCPRGEAGFGVGTYAGASVTISRFVVARAHACGVHIDDGALDLVSGEVRDNPIGACIQTDGYDLDRLQDDVDYIDNASTLQATSLPVPDVTEAEASGNPIL